MLLMQLVRYLAPRRARFVWRVVDSETLAEDFIGAMLMKENNMNELIFFLIPDKCPVCGGETQIIAENNTEVLMCMNEECEGKLLNKLDHFLGKKGLDVKGISKATLEKLMEWGWVNELADIYSLQEHKLDWIKKPGFGVKSVESILSSIENSREPSLEAFILASVFQE